MLEDKLKEDSERIFYYAVFLEDYYKKKIGCDEDLDYDPQEEYEKYKNIVDLLNNILEEDMRERFDEDILYTVESNDGRGIKEKVRKMKSYIGKIF